MHRTNTEQHFDYACTIFIFAFGNFKGFRFIHKHIKEA